MDDQGWFDWNTRALFLSLTMHDEVSGLFININAFAERSAANFFSDVYIEVNPFFMPLSGPNRPILRFLNTLRVICMLWLIGIVILIMVSKSDRIFLVD